MRDRAQQLNPCLIELVLKLGMLLHASRQKFTFVKLTASCLRPVATSFVSFSGLAEESSSFEDTSRQVVVKDKRFIDKASLLNKISESKLHVDLAGGMSHDA